MKKQNLIFLGLVLGWTSLSWAGGDEHGVPFGFIKLQLINFAVFLVILFWIGKTKIAPIFNGVKEAFLAQASEAARKLQEAKSERDGLKSKLSVLVKDYEKNIEIAKSDSSKKSKEKIEAAKVQVAHLNKDLSMHLEGLKRNYASELKDLLLGESITELKTEIGSELNEEVVSKLEDTFVNRVEMGA